MIWSAGSSKVSNNFYFIFYFTDNYFSWYKYAPVYCDTHIPTSICQSFHHPTMNLNTINFNNFRYRPSPSPPWLTVAARVNARVVMRSHSVFPGDPFLTPDFTTSPDFMTAWSPSPLRHAPGVPLSPSSHTLVHLSPLSPTPGGNIIELAEHVRYSIYYYNLFD